jgi:hypothetical protein
MEAQKLGLPVPPKGKKLENHLADQEAHARTLFLAQCKAHQLPVPEFEYHFCQGRRWRADYCFEGLVLVEKVGGIWTRGHHSRGQDQLDDMEKYNKAQLLGYLVLLFTPRQFETGEAFVTIKEALMGLL